jgi:hypothetical protein
MNRHTQLRKPEEYLCISVSSRRYENKRRSFLFYERKRVQRCTPMEKIYLQNMFFATLHILTSLIQMFIYCRYKSIVKIIVSETSEFILPPTSLNIHYLGLAAWSENCKWYNSLPLGAAVSLFCESV